MRSRSSSRYITATFAPTNRNGFCPIMKRPPRWRTNLSRGVLGVEFGEATKTRTAALPIRSAATASSFLFIKLSRIRHSDKTHNRTNRPEYYKQVEECANAQRHTEVNRVLRD